MFEPKVSPAQLSVILVKLKKELKPIKKVKALVKNVKHEWIRTTSTKIIELIEKEIKVYNEQNPDIKLKAVDILSTAQTVLNRLLKAMGIVPTSN